MLHNTIQKLGDAVLRPFGLAWFLDPAPSRGRTWFDYETLEDVPGGPAYRLWFGPVHIVFDRGG